MTIAGTQESSIVVLTSNINTLRSSYEYEAFQKKKRGYTSRPRKDIVLSGSHGFAGHLGLFRLVFLLIRKEHQTRKGEK